METKTLKIDSDLHEKLKTLATGSKYSIQDIVESKLQELLEHKDDMIFQFEKDINYNTVKDIYTVQLKSYSYHKLIDFLEIFLSNRNLNNVQEIKAVLEASEFLKSYSTSKSKKINSDNYKDIDGFYKRLDLLLCVNYDKYDETKFPFNVPSIPVLINTNNLNCYRKISDESIVRLKKDCSEKASFEYLESSDSYNISIDKLVDTRNKIIDLYLTKEDTTNLVFTHLNVLNDLIKKSISFSENTDVKVFEKMLEEYNAVYHWFDSIKVNGISKHEEYSVQNTIVLDEEQSKIFKTISYSDLSFEKYITIIHNRKTDCLINFKYIGIYDTYKYDATTIDTSSLLDRFKHLECIEFYYTRYDDTSLKNAVIHDLRNEIIKYYTNIQNLTNMVYTNEKHDNKVFEYLNNLTDLLKKEENNTIYIEYRINTYFKINDWFKSVKISVQKPTIFTSTVVELGDDGCLNDRVLVCEEYSDEAVSDFINSLNLPLITTISEVKDIENRERFERFIYDMFNVYNQIVAQRLKGLNINVDKNIKDLDRIQKFIDSIRNKEVVYNIIPVDFMGSIYANVMSIIDNKCVIVKDVLYV